MDASLVETAGFDCEEVWLVRSNVPRGLIGEIMTKSSSCLGEGEGESLCFPLLDGKGDLKDAGGCIKGFGEFDPKVILDEDEDDSVLSEEPLTNQDPGLFSVFCDPLLIVS